MTSKRQEDYEEIFEKCITLVPQMRPAFTILNFDEELGKAVKKMFPNTRIVASWFHYAQVIKHLSFLSFMRNFNSNFWLK